MVHIIDNYYLSSDMKNAKKKKYYSKLSNKIKSLKPGVKSPNIIMKDTSGIFQNMHNTVAKAKMLIFYSSECPHCIETLPKLVEIYNMYKTLGLETFGISIDNDRNLWTSTIRELNLNWINLSDLKGMNSPIIDTYNITNTPSIIILNKDNIIMTKPKNIDDIHATLVELLNQ
jgi:peroxiredoxin